MSIFILDTQAQNATRYNSQHHEYDSNATISWRCYHILPLWSTDLTTLKFGSFPDNCNAYSVAKKKVKRPDGRRASFLL